MSRITIVHKYGINNIDLGEPGTLPAEMHEVFGIPRLGQAELVDLEQLPGRMSHAQASNDLKTLEITTSSAATMSSAYKAQNYSRYTELVWIEPTRSTTRT